MRRLTPAILAFATLPILGGACTTDHKPLFTQDIVSFQLTVKCQTQWDATAGSCVFVGNGTASDLTQDQCGGWERCPDAELGTDAEPLAEDSPHTIHFDLMALGADGQIREDYNATQNLWLFFEGALAPVYDGADGTSGSQLVTITDGAAIDQVRILPLAFGPTTLWVEDVTTSADGTITCTGPYPPYGGGANSCSFATGASATIHYRNPYIDEARIPPDPNATDAPYTAQLQGHAAYFDHTHDPATADNNYNVVVTAAFAQAFAITDMSPAAVARGYNSIYVFSYSRALRNDQTGIMAGDIAIGCYNGVCSGDGASCDGYAGAGYVAGGVTEFVGFCELSFPVFNVYPIEKFYTDPTTCDLGSVPDCRCGLSYKADGSACDPKIWAPCPEPLLIDPMWLKEANGATLEKSESGLVRVVNARVCTFDPTAWSKYGQFTVDVGTGCNLAIASKGVVDGLDPVAAQGSTIAEIIGNLRNLAGPSSSGAYSDWIIYPRTADDVDCGTATGCIK